MPLKIVLTIIGAYCIRSFSQCMYEIKFKKNYTEQYLWHLDRDLRDEDECPIVQVLNALGQIN